MNFPLITWADTVGPITINSTLYNVSQQRYGFGIDNTTTKNAASDTVADFLRDAVNSVVGAGTVVVTSYVYTERNDFIQKVVPQFPLDSVKPQLLLEGKMGQ